MPTRNAEVEALLERLRVATDRLPDDTLGEMLCVLEGREFGWTGHYCGDGGGDELYVTSADEVYEFRQDRGRCPDVFIDAARALLDRVLPGADYEVRRVAGRTFGKVRFAPLTSAEEECATEALSLLAALLSAKLALTQEAAHEHG